MYMTQAKQLEDQGKYKEAEKLYALVKKPEMSVAMYKKAQQYDQMMRLIGQHFPDSLEDAHVRLAGVSEKRVRMVE